MYQAIARTSSASLLLRPARHNESKLLSFDECTLRDVLVDAP
jgi:hypothetical protein